MHWQDISLDEYAAFQISCGAKLCQVGRRWWSEVAPFFFRPLNPLEMFDPLEGDYPAIARVGGIQHAVPNIAQANSFMNFFIYEDLKNYDLSQLKPRRRRETRRSLEHFTARRITNCREFIEQAHPIYREFFERTRYGYRKERLEREGFERWGKALFGHQRIMVLGIYQRGCLSAVDISFRLGGVIFDDTFFSSSESQRLHITNFLVHTLRQAAAESDATWLCRGAPTTRPGVDQSKSNRGCRLVALPARYQANPLALTLLKSFCRRQYRRLVGVPTQQSGSPISLPC